MQQDTDLFPTLAIQTLLQSIGREPGTLHALACEQVGGYARHMRQLSGGERHPLGHMVVGAMADDSRRLLFQQLLEWGKSDRKDGSGFAPPWWLVEELCEDLMRGGEPA